MHRARDPGLKLAGFGRVTWVHCPQCDGPAKNDAQGTECLRCGYMTMQQTSPAPERWARISLRDPRCSHCRNPLPTRPLPTASIKDGDLHVRVKCPACAEIVDYPADFALPPAGASRTETTYLKLYLTVRVGGETLWVDNLAHLAALEDYLGAKVRERGPVRGLTMMARLPAWMKSATMRPKVLRGLRHLRERAERAGIEE
ncbi:MAG TPA: hypothetical protein VI168_19270 [Croceibacterium sp.]